MLESESLLKMTGLVFMRKPLSGLFCTFPTNMQVDFPKLNLSKNGFVFKIIMDLYGISLAFKYYVFQFFCDGLT